MKKSERIVLYYDLNITAKSRSFAAPKSISVKRAFELIQLIPADQRIKELSKGKELLYISDWNWVENTLSILVNKSDKAMSDPVFTVPKKKKRRTAEKQEDEGQDFSIHMLVKLPENHLEPGLVLIEQCIGLSIFTVQKLFNQLLLDAKKISPSDFQQIHPDGSLDSNGKPKNYNVNFGCEFDGHLSDELKDDLNHGKIQTIELITDKQQYTPFDDDGYIKEKCKTLVLTLKDEGRPIYDKFERISKLISNKKNDYGHAKIKFKSSTGVDRTVEIDTSEGLAQSYVKKGKLEGFDFDLKSSYEKFNRPILEKMKALLS